MTDNKEKQKQYLESYAEDDAPGWIAIDAALDAVYPKDRERHYPSHLPAAMGGNDPLYGVSIYDNKEQVFHRHLVSYGMSDLFYDPELAGNEYSGWGFEFTARLVPYEEDRDGENKDGSIVKNEPYWAINLMQNLARYVFDSGRYFEPYHFIATSGGIRADTDSMIVGIVFVPDPVLGSIDTPHGKVEFLQIFGITENEMDWILENPSTDRAKELIEKAKEDNPMFITDLKRTKDYV